jgi:type II secretory pathway pseudopilin PulG
MDERRAADDGIGLIEVVVAMVVLAILAIAMVPLLMQGLIQSKSNATLAAATQFADTQLDAVNSVTACSSVPTEPLDVTDSRGVDLTIIRSRGTCPTTFPGTIGFSVTVVRDDTGAILVSADTLVYVTDD